MFGMSATLGNDCVVAIENGLSCVSKFTERVNLRAFFGLVLRPVVFVVRGRSRPCTLREFRDMFALTSPVMLGVCVWLSAEEMRVVKCGGNESSRARVERMRVAHFV